MANDPDTIFTEQQWELLESRLSLPPRQRQVIRHLFNGQSDKQIADSIGVALPTVRSHLRRVYRRFEVQDRTELVLRVVREFIRMNDISSDVMSPDDN